jgi:hypothetical protein
VLLNEAAGRLSALASWNRGQYEETGCFHFELDARACEAAAAVLIAALGEGAATEQDADRLIKGYPVIRRRLEKLHEHFEVVGEPLPRENGKRACPACLCYVRLCDNYCRWCGKPIRVRKRGLKRAKDK